MIKSLVVLCLLISASISIYAQQSIRRYGGVMVKTTPHSATPDIPQPSENSYIFKFKTPVCLADTGYTVNYQEYYKNEAVQLHIVAKRVQKENKSTKFEVVLDPLKKDYYKVFINLSSSMSFLSAQAKEGNILKYHLFSAPEDKNKGYFLLIYEDKENSDKNEKLIQKYYKDSFHSYFNKTNPSKFLEHFYIVYYTFEDPVNSLKR